MAYSFLDALSLFQTQILQGLSHYIFLGKHQDIIIQLKRIEYSEIDTYCYRRCAFLYSGDSKRAKSKPLPISIIRFISVCYSLYGSATNAFSFWRKVRQFGRRLVINISKILL